MVPSWPLVIVAVVPTMLVTSTTSSEAVPMSSVAKNGNWADHPVKLPLIVTDVTEALMDAAV